MAALETQYNSSKRKFFKFNLTKMLLKKGWSHEKIKGMLKFLDGVIRLPEQLELEYSEDIRAFEEAEKVSYMTSFEYFGIKKGESNIILSQLETKFGQIPESYVSKINQASADTILLWAKKVLTAQTLEDVFSV